MVSEELEALQVKYNDICQLVSPVAGQYTFLTEGQDNGSPHVEFIDNKFHYVVTERGLELDRRSTTDADEIVYWMVYDLTFWMGVAYEFENRVDGLDSRRMIFEQQTRLMKNAGPQFAGRLAKRIENTLKENPFVDRAATSMLK